jgi:hypothetical protein
MVLSPHISQADFLTSSSSVDRLQSCLLDPDRSLVFFVGAGACIAGNTGMPSTPRLLSHLLLQALSSSGTSAPDRDRVSNAIMEATSLPDPIGFEITLNDFWQICRQATKLLYEAFSELEGKCVSNRVHAFLAHWLSAGGTVVTTNYDRLIEREWARMGGTIRSRYQDGGANSFANWRDELRHGGTLFKIHGSLDDAGSCLGALEHVGTRLSGQRAELMQEIVRTRPLCFIGWQGVDPDIPVFLSEIFEQRNPALPTFWIHYEGFPPGSISLQKAFERCSPLIMPYAKSQPILTEADRAFGEFLSHAGLPSIPNSARETESFDFSRAAGQCTTTGLARMVGITLRRAGKGPEAKLMLAAALKLAETTGERSAALQEISLMEQQSSGRKTDQARRLLEQAGRDLKEAPDPNLQLNNDFGLLSMTIINLKSRPWRLLVLPRLFHRYRQGIERVRRKGGDGESVALHESLMCLFKGRLRFKLFGWLGVLIPLVAAWILKPFNDARSRIRDARDIHLHSHIDVLAYRALALAHLGRCQEAQKDFPEIHRLVAILNDDARTQHWKKQVEKILRYCA